MYLYIYIYIYTYIYTYLYTYIYMRSPSPACKTGITYTLKYSCACMYIGIYGVHNERIYLFVTIHLFGVHNECVYLFVTMFWQKDPTYTHLYIYMQYHYVYINL